MTAIVSEIDFIDWRSRMIVGLADAMPHDGGVIIGARQLARQLGLLESESWIDALRMELEQKRWAYVDWDGNEVGFELHGEGLLEAARLRRASNAQPNPIARESINWTKWGTIIGAVGVFVAIIIAVVS